jgi:glycosyltransferase A (GT-A) superfamily protein (DUF2064 family)
MATSDHTVVICLIAKSPIAGQSKTRLQPFLDANGSALLARAMLLDVLCAVTNVASKLQNTDLLLFYAPPTEEGRQVMSTILHEESNLSSQWTLLPVNYNPGPDSGDTPTSVASSGRSSNLSTVLTNAVKTAYQRHSVPTTVVLLGMDAPELPLAELRTILEQPTPASSAVLCPAEDGGYALLSLPPCSRSLVDRIFYPVHPYWSHPWTALAQIKALSDVGISTILGPVVADIDTPDDLQALSLRLASPQNPLEGEHRNDAFSSLHQPSVLVARAKEENHSPNVHPMPAHPSCPYTRQALMELQLLGPKDTKTLTVNRSPPCNT